MSAVGTWLQAGHTLIALAAVLLAAYAGRSLARLVRQPAAVAEIAAGLLAGLVVLAAGGRHTFHVLLPAGAVGWLKAIGSLGLVLFLVGVAHQLRVAPNRSGRATGRAVAGSLLVPLACGALFAWWILHGRNLALRGHAPAPSLALFLSLALSVTAVPVLARMLPDRGTLASEVGRLAMAVAIVLDMLTWLLAVAIGLAHGVAGVWPAVGTLAAGVAAMLAVRRMLSSRRAGRFAARFPRTALALIALFAVGAAEAMHIGGLTDIFGAVLAGLAIPGGGKPAEWTAIVHTLSRFGRWLLPVYFVAIGITVFTPAVPAIPWPAIALVIALGMAGKLLGSFLGGRIGGTPRPTALRLAALLRTRGLTELVVLQAGYQAGILTPALLTAMVVMALSTTVMVWPAYAAADRMSRRNTADADAPPPTAPVRPADFRALMGTFPTGVAVVATLADDGMPRGMTCSSVCSVAVEPPTLLVCLRQGSPTLRAMLRLSTFTVNLLHQDAVRTAQLFASGDPGRFHRIEWHCDPTLGGPHLVQDAHAIADCRVINTLPVGDHMVVFGEVFGIRQQTSAGPRPLLYGLRQYSSWPGFALADRP